MSKKLPRKEALENISTWGTEEVLGLLRKNGLEECCKAVAKRQIDGDELLHLTDGKLVLWKSDLTRSLIGQLRAFVQELNRSPENYVMLDKITEAGRIQNDDHFNDNSSWGSSEFEDEMIEENEPNDTQGMIIKPSLIKNRQALLSRNNRVSSGSSTPTYSPKRAVEQEREEIYINYENFTGQDEEENMYTNCEETQSLPSRNVSKLHSQIENSLASKLKEELEGLKRRNQNQATKKPMIGPKPEALSSRKIPMMGVDKKLPQKSFLHDAPKTHEHVPNASTEQNKTQKRMAVPPPSKPKNNKDYTFMKHKKIFEKELPKPPPPLNLDLLANLPAQTEDESQDEYEPLDDSIIKQVQQMSRVSSKQSLHSGYQGSVESVYKPPSATSYEEQEIYSSITEAPDDDGYESPIQRISETQQRPPPLPAKPSPTSSLPNRTKAKLDKAKERSPDKKSPTVPLPSYNTSTERATRPLPPPPERQSYVDKSWFHNVTREQAATLIRDPRTYNNPQDGYFLLRPSTTNPGNPLALVLWYKDRVYNVPVRKRSDNRYALGSVKVNELSFSAVEDIVTFYMKEELMLYSGGIPTGSTRLTDTPPKQF
ncbi:lymphocyte cytosolic protein 2 isoform X1 [Ooceraea biroi]|uniref:lymphocyte cytosolic protein 2 isoform X1 n=2 Tax=Ooceraea biroi TaxID=2015173 RepID=UPI000F07A9A9|nr:lymphocyte cytosolic protein 2 isoform X1 [Ooceraea biroi]